METENTIVDCVFDILFESNSVAESFLSTIAHVDEFECITKLPLYQVSEAIRKNDPNLKTQPLYEITSKRNTNYKITLGDNVIGIAINSNYTSWTNSLFPQIKKLFQEILNSGKINNITRMGLRYVDFLEDENIFKTGKIKVKIDNNESNDKKMFLRIEDFVETIQYNKVITNKTQYGTTGRTGSIIDIITFIDRDIPAIENIESIFSKINDLHDINKEKFKEVISDEYIAKYGI